jgi:hypothetical protein
MLLRTSRMRGVRIDPASQTARAEAGAWWQDVIVPAGLHGMATLAGTSPNVGVTGYPLGGGIGWLARRYGRGIALVGQPCPCLLSACHFRCGEHGMVQCQAELLGEQAGAGETDLAAPVSVLGVPVHGRRRTPDG